MSTPATRQQFIDYCLRDLGHPVIEINVDEDQVNDRVDEAFQFYQQFHFDGVEQTYLSHQITDLDKTNKYITIPDNVIGISRIFPPRSSSITMNMFDLRYQMRLHDLYDFTSSSYVQYVITQQHIRMLDMLFSGEQPIRFNRHTNKLYIDWDWRTDPVTDAYIIIDCRVIVDPDTYTKVYNDRMLKKYATSLIKRQWGQNMSKYNGMKLPGGVELRGKEIWQEAIFEIERLEDQLRAMYEQPPAFIMG